MPRAFARFLTAALLVVAAAPIAQTQQPPAGVFSISDASVSEGNTGTKTLTFTVTSPLGRGNPERRVNFVTEDGSATGSTTYTSRGSIAVNDVVPATPYPSTLVLSGLHGSLRRLKVQLNSVTHTSPADLDILLVGPGGEKVMLMSDAGGENPISETYLAFEDGAPAMTTGQLVTGTYAPTDLQPGETLPPSAPAGPYGTTLDVFNGTDPNGTWSLYVLDDAAADVGTIHGFSLMVTTDDNDFVPARGQLVFAPGVRSQPVNVTIIGDAVAEATELFLVTLYAPDSPTVSLAQAVGAIINDDFPAPTTGIATAVSARGATLNGTVQPSGAPTTAYFEYGLTTSYGNTTPAFNLGSGTAPVAIGNGTIAGLACNTLYHFNIRATNLAGTTTGTDATFKTASACGPLKGDFDGDGKAELTVWRPTDGHFYWLTSSTGYNVGAAGVREWGVGSLGDVPLLGDLDGDRKGDLVVWRPGAGNFYWLTSSSGYIPAASGVKQWGAGSLGDVPILGDVDGDGKADLVVWRPGDGMWYWLKSSSGYAYATAGSAQWGTGAANDVPMLGDLDGDGKADLVVWRPGDGMWYWLKSSSGYAYATAGSAQWGTGSATDVPMLGDIDGDGKADLIVWLPASGTWYWLTSSSGYNAAAAGSKQWGSGSLHDVPMVGDIDGDGKADLIVWRPGDGMWYWLTSSSGYSYGASGGKQWGAAGDVPLIK